MKPPLRILLAASFALAAAAYALAQGTLLAPPPALQTRPVPGAAAPSDRYMFEDQIKPGMKGYGLTVMTGGKIEKFQVEVIDVVKDFNPGNNAILVRCSGLGLEHSGIIAGMSGSPVFLQNKMIGAIAYGWGMAKNPIAGVQPIRQMLAVEPPPQNPTSTPQDPSPKPQDSKPTPQAPSPKTQDSKPVPPLDPLLLQLSPHLPGWKTLTASLQKRTGIKMPQPSRASSSLRPLASPLMVSGLSASSIQLLARELQGTGLVPMQSGSGTAGLQPGEKNLGGIADLKPGEIHLEPGAALAIPLVTGDTDMSAIGTVTEVANGKIYAFGHSFLAQGETRLPIATSYIYTTIPTLSESFKMGTSLEPAGTLIMDEQTGIVGQLGPAPQTVPVNVSIKDPVGHVKRYHYQMAPRSKLTPLILNSLLNETLVAQRELPLQFTARVTGQVTFAPDSGNPITLKIDNLGATDNFKPANSLLPVLVMADNPFEKLHMTALNIDAAIESTNTGGTIRSVSVDRLTLAPGDTIHAVAEIERFQNDLIRVPIALEIPADVPDGDYELLVGNSDMALEHEADYAPQHFDPQDLGSLKTAIDRIIAYQPDHLYAALVMNISGASVAGTDQPDLPASRVAMYASNRRTDAAPVLRVVTQSADAGAILESGGQSFAIHVDHRANERYFTPKSPDQQAGGSPRTPSIPLTAPAATTPNDAPDN